MSHPKVYCGTGHRPSKLGGYGARAFARLVAVARGALERDRPDEVISGMALGWDMALAQAALDLGIPLRAAVPFAGQESRWPAESQTQFARLIAAASTVVIVSPGGYSAAKMQTRNEYMVRESGLVLALFDGTPGGTANCLRFAQAHGTPIRNLYAEWLALA